MTKLLNMIEDLVKLSRTDMIDLFKVDSDENETTVQACSQKTSIVLNGTLKHRYSEIDGTIGINQTQYLRGLLSMKVFQDDATTVTISNRTKNGKTIPDELIFENDGTKASYRFMYAGSIAAMPWFKPQSWEIEFSLPKDTVKLLSQMTGLMSDETTINLVIKDDYLVAHVGMENSSSHKAQVRLINGMSGKTLRSQNWPIKEIMHVFQACDPSSVIRMNDKTMNVEIENSIGIYNFYIQPSQ